MNKTLLFTGIGMQLIQVLGIGIAWIIISQIDIMSYLVYGILGLIFLGFNAVSLVMIVKGVNN